MAQDANTDFPDNTVFCVRKPSLFHVYSTQPAFRYQWTTDKKSLILDLAKKNVEYVVVAPLGYSSTPRYLAPAINAYPQYFAQTKYMDRSNISLLSFDAQKALEELSETN